MMFSVCLVARIFLMQGKRHMHKNRWVGLSLLVLCAVAAVDASRSEAQTHQAQRSGHHFQIRFDYRFDDGYFSRHPERRKTLEAAAAIWGELIEDDFPTVPASAVPSLLIRDDGSRYRGTQSVTKNGRVCQKWTAQIPHKHTRTPQAYPDAGLGDHNYCRNPDGEPFAWCYTTDPQRRFEACAVGIAPLTPAEQAAQPAIDDLVVFVYARPTESTKASARSLNSYPDGELGRTLKERYEGRVFRPWAGVLTVNSQPVRPWFFDQTPDTVDDIPNGTHYDFLTTALHELGHVLGIMRDDVKAFDAHVQSDVFNGPAAMKANGGKPVQLAKDSGHILGEFVRSVLRPHLENDLMGTHDPIQGYRQYPSAVDAGILSDLGYHISSAALARYVPAGRLESSAYQDAKPDPRGVPASWAPGGQQPIAMWSFDDARFLNGARRGVPVLFRPPRVGVIGDLVVAGGIRVPAGGFLYAEHPRTTGNCSGKDVNCYTFVFDVRTQAGHAAPLLNLNMHNENGADLWIKGDGRVGDTKFSAPVMQAGHWHRVVYVVDLRAGVRRTFVDGVQVLQEDGGDLDGRLAVNVSPPRFVLFGDDKAVADQSGRASVDIRHVVFYDVALTEAQVAKLGGSSDP